MGGAARVTHRTVADLAQQAVEKANAITSSHNDVVRGLKGLKASVDEQTKAHDERLDGQGAWLETQEREIGAMGLKVARALNLVDGGFLARMRWLVTGS